MSHTNQPFHGKVSEVRVIEHSRSSKSGTDLITFQLKYPRYIHAEFMTHRVFSRNASSSRAIPAKKLIAQVREEPVFFAHVGKNIPGMQAVDEVHADTLSQFQSEWKELANITADYVERWSNDYGIHKQVANRVLEAFTSISVVVTSSQWDNFFELRDHADAQPEIKDLAGTMRAALAASVPRILDPKVLTDPRAWHLPYVTMQERQAHPITELLAMSAARCARVSYLTHDGMNPLLAKDIELYRRLVESKPLHASPLEHQAIATSFDYPSKNLTGGWMQHRTLLETAGSIDQMHERMGFAPAPVTQ
ncbi:thymidylate synthase [Burkholderia phage BcepSauron]|uniref:Thymidylate synthase n=1 Tax=Burkholderia phage BcepSauron TaxID=2530033 RepID=A0A482MLU2_9CAUD|nr:thymidylate synthase [Burkholderia phage BcepSauron]QBQ74618.1 thymidylate synthase [Burkholderia phage BcepSauron]